MNQVAGIGLTSLCKSSLHFVLFYIVINLSKMCMSWNSVNGIMLKGLPKLLTEAKFLVLQYSTTAGVGQFRSVC